MPFARFHISQKRKRMNPCIYSLPSEYETSSRLPYARHSHQMQNCKFFFSQIIHKDRALSISYLLAKRRSINNNLFLKPLILLFGFKNAKYLYALNICIHTEKLAKKVLALPYVLILEN